MGTLLDIAIGLILIYLAISLVVTAMQEAISSLLGKRADQLRQGIANLFGAPEQEEKAPGAGPDGKPPPAARAAAADSPEAKAVELLTLFSSNPLIASLARTNRQPSYIPAENFARAVIGIASQTAAVGAAAQEIYKEVEDWAETHKDTRIGAGVKMLLVEAQGDLNKLQAELERWFNNVMDRVSGTYKRWAQWVGIGLGSVAAVLLNADSISIVTKLSSQEALRSAISAIGVTTAQGSLPSEYGILVTKLASSGLIGWTEADLNSIVPVTLIGFGLLMAKLLGCAITGFATSLGAAFWFDTLQRVVRVRATGDDPKDKK